MLIETKEDWQKVFEIIVSGKPAKMVIDGYNVNIYKLPKNFRVIFVPVINGGFAWNWANQPDADFVKRFFPVEQKRIYTAKSIREFEKAYGRREAKKKGAYKTEPHVNLWWGDFRKLMKHFMSANETIWLQHSTIFDRGLTLVEIEGGLIERNLIWNQIEESDGNYEPGLEKD
jgi:hypothetical protein